MNISDVVNDLKLTLGLNTIALPYNQSTENVVAEILKTSIRTFSRFKPNIKEGVEEYKYLRSPSDDAKRVNIYYLPESLTTTPVHEADAEPISGIANTGEVTSNSFTVTSPFIAFGAYYPQDVMNATATGVAINKYTGVSTAVPSSKWLGYNKIQLFNFPNDSFVRFRVKCDHDLTGETIPESCVESFMELASLDVQRVLYAQLKQMQNVGSAFKEINLKIDDWSGAEAARKELINKWTDSFHYDELDLVQFF